MDPIFSAIRFSPGGAKITLDRGPETREFLPILGENLTIEAAGPERFCAGRADLATGRAVPCPDGARVGAGFLDCPACRLATGFNPAWYFSSEISDAQKSRNAQPHAVYLAAFAEGAVKVGMTFAARGDARFWDQGARAGRILKVFQTADGARTLEARLAALPGIRENFPTREKLKFLGQNPDPAGLRATLDARAADLARELGMAFDPAPARDFDGIFFAPGVRPREILADAAPVPGEKISGKILGVVGGIFVFENFSRIGIFPAKNLVGARVRIRPGAEKIDFPPRQIGLF